MKKINIHPDAMKLYGIVVLMLAAFWGLILLNGKFQEQQGLKDAESELGYLRSAVAQHTESLFHAVESDLKHIDLWLQANPKIDPLRDSSFLALIDVIRRESGGLIDPRMVSTDGHLYYLPARGNQSLADVHDRPYYLEALKLGPGKMYIADPVFSRVTGKWGIPVSMQLTKAVGGMQVVFAAIELEKLQAVHETYRIPSGSILMMRLDGTLLARTPFDAKVIGRNFSQEPFFPPMRDQLRGTARATGRQTDGVARVFAFQHLKDYPVLVAVGRSVNDSLSEIRQEHQRNLALALFLSLVVLFVTWRMALQQHKVRQLNFRSLKAAAELVAAQNASPLGLFRMDAQRQLIEANAAWRQIHALADNAPLASWQSELGATESMGPGKGTYLPEGEHVLSLPGGQRRLVKVKCADIVIDGVVTGVSGTVEDVTELRVNQKAQQMLKEALDLSSDIVVQSDAEGKILYANAALFRFFGLDFDLPYSSLDGTSLLGEDQLQRREKEMLPTAVRQGHWQGETVVTNSQGELRTMSHLLIAHRDAEGTVRNFSGILRDITEQKQSHQHTLENMRRMRVITDNVPCMISEIGDDYIYRYANRAYQDWLGIAPDSMIGRTVEQVLGREVFQTVGPHHAAAFRGERVGYVREVRRGGMLRWLHINLVPRLAADGQPNGCFAIAFDITDIRMAEEALRMSEQRMHSIADRLPMRLSIVDQEERYRFVNLAYERAFSKPREVLYGLTVKDVLGDAAYERVAPHLRRALAGESVSFDSEMTTAEGYRCYRAEYIPQYAADARSVAHIVAIITDTTGQKLEERRLIALSQRDPLTSVLNRAGFDARLNEALLRAQTSRSILGLMYLDIDHFKQVNDGNGHQVGDLLLQGFAGRLAKVLRATDTIARLGGDEFAILLDGLDSPHSAARVAENIVAAMREPFVFEDRTLTISTSIGVAVYAGEGSETPRELIRRADEQLYLAKGAGRNRFCVEAQNGV